MKTYKFYNTEKTIECEVITDAIGSQESFTITEWPPRGWNSNIASLMPDWSIKTMTQYEFISFAKENKLGLIVTENGKDPVELVTIE